MGFEKTGCPHENGLSYELCVFYKTCTVTKSVLKILMFASLLTKNK